MLPIYSTRRKFLRDSGAVVLGAGLGGWILAACGGEEDGGDTAVITEWSGLSGAELQEYFAENIQQPFTEEHPGIELEVSFQDSTELERLIRVALQAGEGPDLVITNGPAFVAEFAEAGFLTDLGPYAEEHNWGDKLLPWALDAGVIDGTLYSLPRSFEALILYTNQTLFDERGWEPPTNREELEALAEEAMGEGVIPFAAGNADLRQTVEWYTSIFFSHYAGPEVMYQVLTGEMPWTSDPVVGAIETMRDYFQRGWFGGGVEGFFTGTFDGIHAMLGEGEAAMCMEGTWLLSEIDQFFGSAAANENEWGWAPIPSLGEGVPYPIYTIGLGSTVSINADSPSPDAVAEYMNWLYSEPERVAERIADYPADFYYPIRLDPGDLPERMEARRREVIVSMSDATAQGNIGYTNWTFSPPRTALYIYEEVERVLTDDITAQEYLAGVDEVFQQELAEDALPPVIRPTS